MPRTSANITRVCPVAFCIVGQSRSEGDTGEGEEGCKGLEYKCPGGVSRPESKLSREEGQAQERWKHRGQAMRELEIWWSERVCLGCPVLRFWEAACCKLCTLRQRFGVSEGTTVDALTRTPSVRAVTHYRQLLHIWCREAPHAQTLMRTASGPKERAGKLEARNTACSSRDSCVSRRKIRHEESSLCSTGAECARQRGWGRLVANRGRGM